MEQKRHGNILTSFSEDDAPQLRALLATIGVTERLQEDPAVEKLVSHVAKMAGAQALCGAIFCDNVIEAYHADGGANLVIVDARNPIDSMGRNNIIGTGDGQVHPASIIPIYIDTPAEVAAARMGGEFNEKLAMIQERRHTDATRPEFPVKRPTDLVYDLHDWYMQFSVPKQEVARPHYLDNGEDVSLAHIQHFAGQMASAAQDIASSLADVGIR